MLIRPATKADIPAWLALGHEKDLIVFQLTPDVNKFWDGFKSWVERKIEGNEAFMAIDRIPNRCLGVIAFSKKHNQVTFISVIKEADFEKVGEKLLQVVLNQLGSHKAIIASVLQSDSSIVKKEKALYEKHGFKEHYQTKNEVGLPTRQLVKTAGKKESHLSFHFDYPSFIEWKDEKKCPFCNHDAMWKERDLIAELKYVAVYASPIAQGSLWGKCEVFCRKHFAEIQDIPEEDLANFIKDVQKIIKTLKEVSGAVRINIAELGNTIPHIHLHLFPRYLDDLHAGKPIDYNIIKPMVYENAAEYDFFVQKMREKLK
jgi:diadenosine tetraphosphate (Ap4A) HIT family hydrolase